MENVEELVANHSAVVEGKASLPFDIEDGRDELNLAEFPLAAIADRVPDNQKTLVFEDKIFDSGKSEMITRRLTISASDTYWTNPSSDVVSYRYCIRTPPFPSDELHRLEKGACFVQAPKRKSFVGSLSGLTRHYLERRLGSELRLRKTSRQ